MNVTKLIGCHSYIAIYVVVENYNYETLNIQKVTRAKDKNVDMLTISVNDNIHLHFVNNCL